MYDLIYMKLKIYRLTFDYNLRVPTFSKNKKLKKKR